MEKILESYYEEIRRRELNHQLCNMITKEKEINRYEYYYGSCSDSISDRFAINNKIDIIKNQLYKEHKNEWKEW